MSPINQIDFTLNENTNQWSTKPNQISAETELRLEEKHTAYPRRCDREKKGPLCPCYCIYKPRSQSQRLVDKMGLWECV